MSSKDRFVGRATLPMFLNDYNKGYFNNPKKLVLVLFIQSSSSKYGGGGIKLAVFKK